MDDNVKGFFTDAEYQDSPLRELKEFLKKEKQNEEAKKYEEMMDSYFTLEK